VRRFTHPEVRCHTNKISAEGLNSRSMVIKAIVGGGYVREKQRYLLLKNLRQFRLASRNQNRRNLAVHPTVIAWRNSLIKPVPQAKVLHQEKKSSTLCLPVNNTERVASGSVHRRFSPLTSLFHVHIMAGSGLPAPTSYPGHIHIRVLFCDPVR